MKTLKTFFNPEKVTSFVLYLSILTFIIAFNFSDHGGGGWQLQTLPFLNDRPLRDMTFTDSLTGYGITKGGNNGDSDYVIKTTNGGNNWFIAYTTYNLMNRIIFLNSNTGFICGSKNWYSSGLVLKTTNSGKNWFSLNASFALEFKDMFVLNEDTIWLVDDNGFSGGVFRTINGGFNWIQQYSGYDPSKIYMVNKDIGFFNDGSPGMLLKTTNGGFNWSVIPGQSAFYDISFVDSLVGWKRNAAIGNDTLVKTKDGGLTWSNADVPRNGLIYGGNLNGTVGFFESINKDTLWGSGGQLKYSNTRYRGILYRSSNGGDDWLIQVPDTSLGISYFNFLDFVDTSNGWSYNNENGIHTTSGGDTTFYTKIKDNNLSISNNFTLFQNYPNPFNPNTKIIYELNLRGRVLLKVYNSLGIEMATLVDQNQNIGVQKVDFNGSKYSSGVYFYSLFIDNERIDTKKMILLK